LSSAAIIAGGLDLIVVVIAGSFRDRVSFCGLVLAVATASAKSTESTASTTTASTVTAAAVVAASVVTAVVATTISSAVGRGWDGVGHSAFDLSELVGDCTRQALGAGDGAEANQGRERGIFDEILSGLVAIEAIAK